MTEAELIDGIRLPGRFDAEVESEAEEKRLIRAARPHAVELQSATADPYPAPPPGVKAWFQTHPPEPGVGHELPHVKYADWTGGKKGRGGTWGHLFFPPPADPPEVRS